MMVVGFFSLYIFMVDWLKIVTNRQRNASEISSKVAATIRSHPPQKGRIIVMIMITKWCSIHIMIGCVMWQICEREWLFTHSHAHSKKILTKIIYLSRAGTLTNDVGENKRLVFNFLVVLEKPRRSDLSSKICIWIIRLLYVQVSNLCFKANMMILTLLFKNTVMAKSKGVHSTYSRDIGSSVISISITYNFESLELTTTWVIWILVMDTHMHAWHHDFASRTLLYTV